VGDRQVSHSNQLIQRTDLNDVSSSTVEKLNFSHKETNDKRGIEGKKKEK